MRTISFIRFCYLFVLLVTFSIADKFTSERIRKHQEWLKKHKLQKQKLLLPQNTSFTLAKFWRFHKRPSLKQTFNMNEVYPDSSENELTTESIWHHKTQITTVTPSNRHTNESSSFKTELDTTPTFFTTPASTTPAVIKPEVKPSTNARKTKSKIDLYPRWASWSNWSDCSRSCGGGIRFQHRNCIDRNSTTATTYICNKCVGLYKRYQLCNENPCPATNIDFRTTQCTAFNGIDFQGQRYNWEPYVKNDAECELNCKPVGMKFFATLREVVIDGTPCTRPAEYYRSNYTSRSICVDGICKAIQSSGLVTGLYANSGSVSCGGLICRPITRIFTREALTKDTYVHVGIIPAGSSNISITELKNSPNLLVLRTMEQNYIFNGNKNQPSESGAYEAVGALFDYHHIDGLEPGEGVTEWITCTGPIKSPIELLIYNRALNPGIKYEYLLPITNDSDESDFSLESDGFLKSGNEDSYSSVSRSQRRTKFKWKVVGFNTCTKSCGGGTHSPIIRCVRENPIRYYSQRRCLHSEKPILNENLLRCNTQPCPAYWRVDNWSDCRCLLDEGYRERDLSCVQELATGIVIHVEKSACMNEQPPSKKPCKCPKSRHRQQTRYHISSNSTLNGQYRIDQKTTHGVWLMSDWNRYCSVECGLGVEYRTIFCNRSQQSLERCDPRETPEISRACDSKRLCDTGEWFTGPWSPCNGNCFNLTRTRQVLCIQNQLITDDADCNAESKPKTVEKCSHKEAEYCLPRWHYSKWSECTKLCDGGTQRRSVKCLELDNEANLLRESNKCRFSHREPIYRACNSHKCDEGTLNQIQNDEATSCINKFKDCEWAVQVKLCKYDYYRENCCHSCSRGV